MTHFFLHQRKRLGHVATRRVLEEHHISNVSACAIELEGERVGANGNRFG